MINRQLTIVNNLIRSVSKDYSDNSAILSTYVDEAQIVHNDISDTHYDAIDIGYGWGMHDAGGNPNYRTRMHDYDWTHWRSEEQPAELQPLMRIPYAVCCLKNKTSTNPL